jgi:beta-galactosidase
MPESQGIWRNAGPDRRLVTLEAIQAGSGVVKVTAKMSALDDRAPTTIEYLVHGNGRVQVSATVDVEDGLPDMPRFGMQLKTGGAFENARWYGRGPEENYWDRKTGYAIGIYSSTVDDLNHQYSKPQETGNRTDVRWLELTNNEGYGIRIEGSPTIDFSAWPYAMEAMEQYTHPHLMPRDDDITLNIDYRQMGVGGDNSWGKPPHDQYRLWPGKYTYTFSINPLGGDGRLGAASSHQ